MKTEAGLSGFARVFFFVAGFLGTSFLFMILGELNVTGLRGEHVWIGYADHYHGQRKADAVLLAWFAIPGVLLAALYLWRRPKKTEFDLAARLALIGLGAALLLRGLLFLIPGYL